MSWNLTHSCLCSSATRSWCLIPADLKPPTTLRFANFPACPAGQLSFCKRLSLSAEPYSTPSCSMDAGVFTMRTTLRLFTLLTALLLGAMILTPALHAAASSSRPQGNSPESVLLNAANRDRVSLGLQPFQWDTSLAAAARLHALRMAQRSTLSHQFPGEPPLPERPMQAGPRFRLIAEDMAEGPSPQGLHVQWVSSPPHRGDLLDRELNSIGIAVVQSGNLLFAVQDFSVGVPKLSSERQDWQIEAR